MIFSQIKKIYGSIDPRSQLVKRNIIYGFGIKGVSIIASLLLVPLTIGYISSELYGVWLTLSSVIQWISFFDIGFGNGLRNKLGETIALQKLKMGKIYVSSTYFVMALIFLPITVLGYFLIPLINWAHFINVSEVYNHMLVMTTRIILLSFSIQMILKLIQNVSLAYQMTAFSSFIDMIGQVLSLFFIYLLTKIMAPNLSYVALVFCFAPLFVLLVANIVCYSGKFKDVSPNLHYVNIKAVKSVFSLGSEFFIIQISALFLFQIINILIARMCGPDYVTNYNIVYKYLNTALMFMTIALAPTWSAFTDAYVKRDIEWMQRIYRRFIQLFFFSVIVIALCVTISPLVYMIWLGDKVNISIWLTFLVGIYMCINIWCSMHSLIINGIGKIKFQLYTAIVMMLFFLPISVSLGKVYGLYGILLAMILINLPGVFYGRYQVKKLISFTAKGIFNE